MTRHIILWKLKAMPDAEKETVIAGIKSGLEGLKGKIPGLLDIQVHTAALPSSNTDLMLESSFTDAAALKVYAEHPEHVAVANAKVRPFTELRLCFDF